MKLASLDTQDPLFKRALIFSVSAHIILFIVLLLSPHIPKPKRKGLVHYVNVISFPGGGGSLTAASETQLEETALPERESLRDLTLSDRVEQDSPEALHFPTEKPQRDNTPKTEKKAVIQKPPTKKTSDSSSQPPGEGAGSGIKLGFGGGSGSGFGVGSEYASQIGLSNFPYTYYLQILHGRISTNWYPAQAVPGLTGNFHTTVLFKIFRNGRISTVEIMESSGVRALDMSAVRAVQNAAPFPPLPQDYEDEYLIIRLIFEHKK